MKRIIIAFLLIMTLVCASAVEADLPETTGGSADAYNADSVDVKSDLEILESFIEHLELLEIKEGKERELKDILVDLKKELSDGNDKVTTDAETESKAPVVDTDKSVGTVSDDSDEGISGTVVVLIVLVAIIIAAVLVVAFVPGADDKLIGALARIGSSKRKKNKKTKTVIPDQSYQNNVYSQSPTMQSYSQPGKKIPEPSSDMKRDPARIAAAFEAEKTEGAPMASAQVSSPAVDKMQLACDSILRCYNGENIDVTDWQWYELDRSSAIGQDDYIRKMDDGYSVLNFAPVKGSKLFHEYVILNGKYLFPNFYSKSPLTMYDRNEKFIRKFNETYMSYTFKCYNRSGNKYDFAAFNRPGDVRIIKIVPAMVRVDEETGVARVIHPGEIFFN